MMPRLHSHEWNFEGRVVRTCTGKDGGIRFVAADICRELKLSNSRKALSRLDEDEKEVLVVPTPGGPQEMLVVNESGLYALIFTSRKEEAKRFKKWVTSEMLPTIRKTGVYGITPEEHDPILVGTRAMGDLRVAQLARERHSAALAEAIEGCEKAMLALAPHARRVMDWAREQAMVQPAADPAATQATLANGSWGPLIGEASEAPTGMAMRIYPDDEDDAPPAADPRATALARIPAAALEEDDDDVPAPLPRRLPIPPPDEDDDDDDIPAPIPPQARTAALRAAADLLDDDDDDDIPAPVKPADRKRTRKVEPPFEEPPSPKRATAPKSKAEEKLAAPRGVQLGKNKRKDG